MGTRERGRRRGRSRSSANGGRGRAPDAAERRDPVRELTELTPFSIFCAFHLGITETDGYAPQDAASVARRFGLGPEQLEAYLDDHRLRREDLEAADFSRASARLDIQVAPEGISRTELARTFFKEIRAAQAALEAAPDLLPADAIWSS
jgi:hypothetical protein